MQIKYQLQVEQLSSLITAVLGHVCIQRRHQRENKRASLVFSPVAELVDCFSAGRADRDSPSMGHCLSRTCASTPNDADAAASHTVSVNGEAEPGATIPPKTPGGATPANAPAGLKPADGVAAHGVPSGSGPEKVTSADDADVAAGPAAANGDMHGGAGTSADASREQPPGPLPMSSEQEPQLSDSASAPTAAANGRRSKPENAVAQSMAPANDPHAASLAAVLGGGAYCSNASGPPRPACQQQRLVTVRDIRDTLKQAHDPAIGGPPPVQTLSTIWAASITDIRLKSTQGCNSGSRP